MKTTWKVSKFNGGGFVLVRKGDGVAGHPLTTIRVADVEEVKDAMNALAEFFLDERAKQEDAAWAVHKMNTEDDEVA
jgi:hypothetical protein